MIIIITIYKASDAQCNCSPPADRYPDSSRAAIAAPRPTPPVSILSMTPWYGIALWPVWINSSGCAPSQFLVHLAEHGKLKSP